MGGNHIEVESTNPIEKSGILSKPRGIFALIVQDLSDRRGCFCHRRELLSVNLISYLQRCIFKYVTVNILYNKIKHLMKVLRQPARAKAREKPAYPPGLKSQRLLPASSLAHKQTAHSVAAL